MVARDNSGRRFYRKPRLIIVGCGATDADADGDDYPRVFDTWRNFGTVVEVCFIRYQK
jgi:hypothetical protein